MTSDFSYDPVTAVDEATATGEVAQIFADIRQTMDIPLVTSIWRGLAGMEDSLEAVWECTKPVYESGEPYPALQRVVAMAELPAPERLTASQLECVGVGSDELAQVLAVIDAYNRSNGMNLVALAALVAVEPVAAPESVGVLEPSPSATKAERTVWPDLVPLMAQPTINPAVWQMVRAVNEFGSRGPDAHVATLWRHLAHWPALLALIHAAMAPLQASGAITGATERMASFAAVEGAKMRRFVGSNDRISNGDGISDGALGTITGYVTAPTQVTRMVTLGHMLARWLRAAG